MGRPSVLAVDDETRGVELVRRILRQTADVEVAASGEDAAALLSQRRFDLVISDQRMPGMSGIELLARVAAEAPDTGRVLLTGYADMDATIDAINHAHVHAYLNKPCPPDQLRRTVAAVLVQVAQQRERTSLAQANERLEAASAATREAAVEIADLARDLVAPDVVAPDDVGAHAKRILEGAEQIAELCARGAEAASGEG